MIFREQTFTCTLFLQEVKQSVSALNVFKEALFVKEKIEFTMLNGVGVCCYGHHTPHGNRFPAAVVETGVHAASVVFFKKRVCGLCEKNC